MKTSANDTSLRSASSMVWAWRAWFSIVGLMLLLRLTIFFGPWGDRLGLSTAYLLLTWPVVMVLGGVQRWRFRSHLEQHHPQKWAELTGANSDGSYRFPTTRRPAWMRWNVPLGDFQIDQFKRDEISLVNLGLAVLCSYIVMLPLLTYTHSSR